MKALETMSQELEKVPVWFFAVTIPVVLALLLTYFFVIPRWKMEDGTKERYKRYCILAMLTIYVVCIFTITLLVREAADNSRVRLSLLDGFRNLGHLNRASVQDVLNFVLFVPFGFLAGWVVRGKKPLLEVLGAAFLLSSCVELCQLLGRLGAFDADDLLFNTLGGVMGAALYRAFCYAFQERSALRLFLRGVLVLGSALCVCAGILLGSYHLIRMKGQEAISRNVSSQTNRMTSRDPEEIEETDGSNVIRYHGKKYRYNENLTTVLFMGIDQRSKVIEKYEDVSGQSGQADTIFLLVMDQENEELHAIGISRDTMTEIKLFDYRGGYLGTSRTHLGLAYCYGDGKETSCQYMVDAVSNLFYGIPINAYVAMNMEALIKLNDSIGGVTVTVPEDLTWAHPNLVKGKTLTLKGREALVFMKFRDITVPDSNTTRMQRQKQYIVNFMKKAAEEVRKDVSLPATIYKSLAEEMVTNISLKEAVYLAPIVLSMPMDTDNITMLKGEAVQGKVYDEIYVDDDALYELILDVFYVEETEGGS